jgi:hypothetical protein
MTNSSTLNNACLVRNRLMSSSRLDRSRSVIDDCYATENYHLDKRERESKRNERVFGSLNDEQSEHDASTTSNYRVLF